MTTPLERRRAADRAIAARLRAARTQAGLSQEQAGATLGLTFQQLQKYEKGANRVSAGTLMVLAQIYNKPITFFFDMPAGEPDTTAGFFSVSHSAEVSVGFPVLDVDDRHMVARLVTRLARDNS